MLRKYERIKAQSPSLYYEESLGYPKVLVAGVDEVGRGCLAGPVVAAAVVISDKWNLHSKGGPSAKLHDTRKLFGEIADSKSLSQVTREILSPFIKTNAQAWAIGSASVEEIDAFNILNASHLAMERAIENLVIKPKAILIDGKFLPKGIDYPAQAVIKGDQKCMSIAAASILAKVFRDQLMRELALQYPQYDLESNKGYPTPRHKFALLKNGPSLIHRKSFAPVAQFLNG